MTLISLHLVDHHSDKADITQETDLYSHAFPEHSQPFPTFFLGTRSQSFPGTSYVVMGTDSQELGTQWEAVLGMGQYWMSRVTQTNRLWSALVISPCLPCSTTLPAPLPLCTFAVLPRQPPCPASGQPQLSSVEPRVIRDAPSTFAVCFVGHLLERKLYQ